MSILYAVVFQRAGALVCCPHYPQQGVVGSPHSGDQDVPCPQRPEESAGARMGTIDELDPHQSRLRTKEVGVDLIQFIPAQIVVTIAGSPGKISLCYSVILERRQDPGGILFRNSIYSGELLSQLLLCLCT